MQKKINLSPSGMAVSPQIIRKIAVLNKVTLIATIFLTLFIISAVALYLYSFLELRKNESAINLLKNEITTMEKSEQKLILTKDKIAKISMIRLKKSALANIINLESLNLKFTNCIIEPAKIETSSIIENVSGLAQLLTPIYNLENFNNVNLLSLIFKPNTGLIVNLSFEN